MYSLQFPKNNSLEEVMIGDKEEEEELQPSTAESILDSSIQAVLQLKGVTSGEKWMLYFRALEFYDLYNIQQSFNHNQLVFDAQKCSDGVSYLFSSEKKKKKIKYWQALPPI